MKGGKRGNHPESHRNLVDDNQVVVLATNGPDGVPQVTALWFLQDENDGDIIHLSINTSRQKTKNLQTNSSCTLFFVDPATPYRTLEIRGHVTIKDDPDHVFANKVGEKYGANLGDTDKPGESRVVVTITPTKVNTFGE